MKAGQKLADVVKGHSATIGKMALELARLRLAGIELQACLVALVAGLANQQSVDRARLAQDVRAVLPMFGADPDKPSAAVRPILTALEAVLEPGPATLAEKIARDVAAAGAGDAHAGAQAPT